MSIVERFLELNLPAEQCVVIGSGVLDALELRESSDIDLAVSADLFSQLQQSEGWLAEIRHNDVVLLKNDVEVWKDWGVGEDASFAELFKNSIVISGVHFANPQFVLTWKKQRGREKDIIDVKLLKEYLSHE